MSGVIFTSCLVDGIKSKKAVFDFLGNGFFVIWGYDNFLLKSEVYIQCCNFSENFKYLALHDYILSELKLNESFVVFRSPVLNL